MRANPDRLGGRPRYELHVCVIDQYLDRRPVPWRQLQLVGFATMLLASKFEEICPSEV